MLVLWLLALVIAALAAFLQYHGLAPIKMLRFLLQLPKQYSDAAPSTQSTETQPLLPQQIPMHYRYSGPIPDYEGTMAALTRAKSAFDFNEVLSATDLEWMFDSEARAHDFVLLCRDSLHLALLDVQNLAKVVVGLQRYASSVLVAEFIAQALCAKLLDECLALKQEIEQRVPVFDVIYRRIRIPRVQETVLKHFEEQARLLKALPSFVPPVKLLSDIDDTLYAVIHDSRYPEFTVYPGVQQFAREVLMTTAGSRENVTPQIQQRQVFLTGRAEILRYRSELELAASGFSHFTLLTGTLAKMFGSNNIFESKLKNVRRFKRIFGECQLIFVGDNGQGDIDLGRELLRHSNVYAVSAVLIHDVVRRTNPPARGEEEKEEDVYRGQDCESAGIRTFRTYVGAAIQLCQMELLSLEAVVRVVHAASVTFRAIPFRDDAQRERLARELAKEVAGVLQALSPADANALAAILPSAVAQQLMAVSHQFV